MVRLRRTRCHRRHDEHALGSRRDRILCRPLPRGRRDHAARLRGVGRRELPRSQMDRRHVARCRRRKDSRRVKGRTLRSFVRRQRRPAAPRHRSACAVQRTIHVGHHVAAESRVVDSCQRIVGREGQRVASGSAQDRCASGLFAAVSYQRTGLFDAVEPVGRRHLRDPAAVFRAAILAGRCRASLYLEFHDRLLHEGSARSRNSKTSQLPSVGQRGVRSIAFRGVWRQGPSAGGA